MSKFKDGEMSGKRKRDEKDVGRMVETPVEKNGSSSKIQTNSVIKKMRRGGKIQKKGCQCNQIKGNCNCNKIKSYFYPFNGFKEASGGPKGVKLKQRKPFKSGGEEQKPSVYCLTPFSMLDE